MLSLTCWQWMGIAVWVGLLAAAIIGEVVALCRISADAEAQAEALHRQAAQDLHRETPPSAWPGARKEAS